MIKKLLTDEEYTITSTNTIAIDPSIKVKHKNLSLITQTLSNNIVFNFACEDLRATLSGNVITLVDETIILGEELSIILSFEEVKDNKVTEANSHLLKEILTQLKINNEYLSDITGNTVRESDVEINK